MRRLFVLSALVMFVAATTGCQLCPKNWNWRRPAQQGAPCGCETDVPYETTMYPEPGTTVVVPGPMLTTPSTLPGPTPAPTS